MFEIPLKLAVGGEIIPRETIAAVRNSVTAKCRGGDVTRKGAAGKAEDRQDLEAQVS
ncbi:MAG: hypothetical protein MK104_01300 [Erythrobacter sp.]|nr:hypothetical protein [Erythrobacter sp.]